VMRFFKISIRSNGLRAIRPKLAGILAIVTQQ
jgi:hypothetical protein